MTKIETLTPEQVARFPQYVRDWTDIGLSTQPANRPRAETAIRWMYGRANLPAPKIVWCASPLAMCLTRAVLTDQGFLEKMGDSVWASVRASVGDSVWDSVRASVRDSVGDSVYGSHEASWLAFYRFFHDEVGLIAQTGSLQGLWNLAQSCGWILPCANICFASERHSVLHRDERGRLHCETGPACAYPDGFVIYAWHGERVPASWITDRAALTPQIAMSQENSNQRAAADVFTVPNSAGMEMLRLIVKEPTKVRNLGGNGHADVALSAGDYLVIKRRELSLDDVVRTSSD